MPARLDLARLRRHAVARSLFRPTTLGRAILRLGFVQADPIRAPARAQDLTLRLRVEGYRVGDLERRYPRLGVEEDWFVNYGLLPRRHLGLLHPRAPRRRWGALERRRAAELLAFVRERGASTAREVQAAFDHGRTRNAWGGTSHATTHLLDAMHYRGLLRVARREGGLRVFAAAPPPEEDGRSPTEKADALLDLAVAAYAPLPERSLGTLCSFLRLGAPQLAAELRRARDRALLRLGGGEVGGQRWFWPADEAPSDPRWEEAAGGEERLRLLAPFDPVVWDRRRFQLLWGWAYRFEAYTPARRRQRGYYALPLLWRDRVLGWANLAVEAGRLRHQLGFAGAPPRDRAFRRALQEELDRMGRFLGLTPGGAGGRSG